MEKKVLIIIPCYNEEMNILNTVRSIEPYHFDYIVVNDGSKDASEEILRRHGIAHLCLINNLGIGGAMQTGYQYARNKNYDVAVQFDGDGQHNADDIEKLIAPILDGNADMVIGSRFIEETGGFRSSRMRRIGIRILSRAMKKLSGVVIQDSTSGFRAVDKEIIEDFRTAIPTSIRNR